MSTQQRTPRGLVILKSMGALATVLGLAGVFVVWALLSFDAAFGAGGAARFPFVLALAAAASTAVAGAALLAVSFVLRPGSRSRLDGASSGRA